MCYSLTLCSLMNNVLALKCSRRNFSLKYLNTVFKMLKQSTRNAYRCSRPRVKLQTFHVLSDFDIRTLMQDHIEKSVTPVSSWKCWLEDVLCCKIHLIFYFCPLKNEQVLSENSQWFKFWLKGFAARLVRRRINQHTFFFFFQHVLFFTYSFPDSYQKR